VKIALLSGSARKKYFELPKEIAYIGRGQENDIAIDDPSVSRVHARIIKKGCKYFIEDMGSRNGTWVEGSVIARGMEVEAQNGCVIALGDALICLGDMISPECEIKEYTIDLSAEEQLRARDKLQATRKKLEMLHEATSKLLESVDLNEICKKIIESLFAYFKHIDAAVLLIADERRGELREAVSRSGCSNENERPQYSRTIVDQVTKQAKAIMSSDTVHDDSLPQSDSIKGLQIRSVLCVPLISKRRTLGAIYIHSATQQGSFQKEDFFFVTALSAPASLAIDNAMLYEETKKAQKDLRQAHEDLERQVYVRTAELVELNKRLQELSITDGLTGIYNHRHFIHLLEIECNRALRYKRNLSLLMLDIDEFKQVNDGLGHPCGDLVLRHFAKILKGSVRKTDIVARYGGDEFGIILTETKKSMAMKVSEKIRREVEKHPFTWGEKVFRITVSIGVAAALREGVKDWNGLLNAADQALYKAKDGGRNNVMAFNLESPSMGRALLPERP
jgi:diguanylate cyclase (GGDEF)-like protein